MVDMGADKDFGNKLCKKEKITLGIKSFREGRPKNLDVTIRVREIMYHPVCLLLSGLQIVKYLLQPPFRRGK